MSFREFEFFHIKIALNQSDLFVRYGRVSARLRGTSSSVERGSYPVFCKGQVLKIWAFLFS